MPTNRKVNIFHKTGMGFDSHLFGSTGLLKLGGVTVPNFPKLMGHSDGDAVLHAIIDALLGASGLGDIGEWFPDTSSKWKGASSLKMLQDVIIKIKKSGYVPLHIDVTILADQPKITPLKIKIRSTVAKALQLSAASINIKAKTQEGLTLFGNKKGIAVWAIATVTGRK
jgi:2-C-methyl-D-erythritol 2,4-cyclodiphosphate synthase